MPQFPHPPIYRSVNPKADTASKIHKYHTTMRPPGNVPYIVDNLWEWVRPIEYPSRRVSVFGSPTPEFAKESGPDGGIVYQVELIGDYKMCQVLKHSDSKEHEECRSLRKLLLGKLGQKWIDGNVRFKNDAGKLWFPCLRKDDIDKLFNESDLLKPIRDELRRAIKYWDDVILIENGTSMFPDEKGEIFFAGSGGYRFQVG